MWVPFTALKKKSGAIAARVSPDINIFKPFAFVNLRIIRDVDFTQFSSQVISVAQPISVKVASGSHMRGVASDGSHPECR